MAATAKDRVVFSGGPAGGTFQVVANAVQVYDPIKQSENIRVRAQSSAGSVENLRKVNSGKAQMGVVYSGHVYLGRNGQLKNDTRKYEDVMAVAWLYGAPAQLVVRKDSGIQERPRTWSARRSVSAMPVPVLSPTANCSSATWAYGTRWSATRWATTMRPRLSVTSNWMPSGCSRHSRAARSSWRLRPTISS